MRLAKDGIFPIVKDKDGHLLPDLPASGFSLQVPFREKENCAVSLLYLSDWPDVICNVTGKPPTVCRHLVTLLMLHIN